MGKSLKIFLWILAAITALLIIGGSISGYFIYNAFYSSSPLAVLSIDAGTVQYDGGAGWKNAKSGMELEEGQSVKTLESSAAKIIFSDSVMRLDQNTEITLNGLSEDTISLSQKVGRTWTKLLKISGITNYEISTPNAIATVRGTGFSIDANEERTEVKVGDGKVGVKNDNEDTIVEDNEQLVLNKEDTGLEEKKEDLVEDEWISENKRMDAQHRTEVKDRIIKKYGKLINNLLKQQGISEDQAEEFVDRWIDGEFSIKEKIEDGSIPKEIVKLIPADLKRY